MRRQIARSPAADHQVKRGRNAHHVRGAACGVLARLDGAGATVRRSSSDRLAGPGRASGTLLRLRLAVCARAADACGGALQRMDGDGMGQQESTRPRASSSRWPALWVGSSSAPCCRRAARDQDKAKRHGGGWRAGVMRRQQKTQPLTPANLDDGGKPRGVSHPGVRGERLEKHASSDCVLRMRWTCYCAITLYYTTRFLKAQRDPGRLRSN